MKKVILFSIVAILVGCQSQKNLMLNNQWKLTELNGKNLTGENVTGKTKKQFTFFTFAFQGSNIGQFKNYHSNFYKLTTIYS